MLMILSAVPVVGLLAGEQSMVMGSVAEAPLPSTASSLVETETCLKEKKYVKKICYSLLMVGK